MLSFPGWYDTNGSMSNEVEWNNTTFLDLITITDYMWLSLNFLSTVITIFAIIKILKITSTLSLTNSNVRVNKKSLIAHAFALCL